MIYQDLRKKIIAAIRAFRNFGMVFYNFCYFWGQHRQ